MKFNPPISSRHNDELIIIFFSDEENWSKAAQIAAKEELLSRGMDEISIRMRYEQLLAIEKAEWQEELMRRKVEKYTWFEALAMIIKWPRTLFSDWYLRKEGYELKAKRRRRYIGIGMLGYLFLFSYFYYLPASKDQNRNQQLEEEIEAIDISDWEKDRTR